MNDIVHFDFALIGFRPPNGNYPTAAGQAFDRFTQEIASDCSITASTPRFAVRFMIASTKSVSL